MIILEKVRWKRPPLRKKSGVKVGKQFDRVRDRNGSAFVIPSPKPYKVCANGPHTDEHCENCSASGYFYARGCRCDPCRKMHNARVRKNRVKRAKLLEKDPTVAFHGKPSTYRNWGCRCDACTVAHSAACKLYGMRRREEDG